MNTEDRLSAESGQVTRRVLLAGHRAFAARGLAGVLSRRGHEVICFSRGPGQRDGSAVTGPAGEIDRHPGLAGRFDTFVNFIVLRGEDASRNLAYLDSVLRFCQEHAVAHVIHVSSMSVYTDAARVITEGAETKAVSERSTSYAAIKSACEAHLTANLPDRVRLTLIRPACILGPDMTDPLGSVGERLPTGEVLVLARASRQRPVIGRSVMHAAIERLVSSPPEVRHEILLFVDRDSPTCLDYLQACCEILGCGSGAVTSRGPVWMARLLRREVRKGGGLTAHAVTRAASTVRQRLTLQRYDASRSEQRLGMSFRTRWRDELLGTPGTGAVPECP